MKAEDFKSGLEVHKSSSKSSNVETNYIRQTCDYINLCKKFRHVRKDFSKQYCHVYAVRLAKIRDTLLKKAQDKWGPETPVKKLADLAEDGEKCIIVGTLFKHQELKPSILKEISEEYQLVPQQQLTRFVSDKDELVLEDELQRVRLIGRVNVHETVTGIVCAALGFEDESGKFHVEDICWPGPCRVPTPISALPDNRYLILISGLDLAHNASTLLPLKLFVDWVTGWLGEPLEQETISKIARIIIAGNIIRGSSQDKDGKVINTNVSNATDIVSTVQLADDILAELTESVAVDVMPGEFDPTNYSLPQQPIHPCMFPKAWRHKTLSSVTNPYCAKMDGRLITGTSGQPVDDIGRYSDITVPIEALESTLKWGHLAPTAPDTLPSYPYYEDDPFIIDCQPDILFAGNQEEFQTKDVELCSGSFETFRTTLLCIPKFSKSGVCAIVNLSTLECTPLIFQVSDKPMDID